ncbi:hypothetical protein GCM10027168_31670 [Streptomyces capparidis]
MGSTAAPHRPGGSLLPRALGIYLNDHLAGATAGLELCRRAAQNHRGTAHGDALHDLATEIAQDRLSLLRVMETLGVPVRRYKVYGGWMAEKAARLKPNGRVLRRSGLSSVIELELLRLGIEGKAQLWRALLSSAAEDERLDEDRLRELLERAEQQARTAGRLHDEAAAAVLAPGARTAGHGE